VIASVTDNDSTEVIITEGGSGTVVNEEGPTSDTYTIVLSNAPTTDVTITVDPDAQTDLGLGVGQPRNLIFTPANWNTPQTVTVTAVDDQVAEGLHTSIVTHTAVSADPNYNGIAIRNVTASVIDNDTAGVLITQSGGTTEVDETGPTSDTYTVELTLPPTSNVTITVKPDLQTSVGGGPALPINLTFTPANWSVPQTITVTAVDDPMMEGAFHTSTITHIAASSDPNYNGITIDNVTVTVTDNDTAGVVITESGGKTEVSENGPSIDTYAAVLSTPPEANVRITVKPDGQTTVGAGPGQPIMLTFTPANWNVAQTVTVTAIDDQIAEGGHKSYITHMSASSDRNYNAIAISSVYADVLDNDVAGFTITESGGSTNVNEEGPTQDSYTVVMTTPPEAEVVLMATPDQQTDLGNGSGVPVMLTFTLANWNIPQTVTVTAVDDQIAEGLHRSTITHVSASTDKAYNGLSTRAVVAVVTDNDTAGVAVEETAGSTQVNETGPTSDSYTLVLTGPPTSDVVITAVPDSQIDLGNGPGQLFALTFTRQNWRTPQMVKVTAIDDQVAEGTHGSTITHTIASSDTVFNGATIRPVTVMITDNDVAGVTLNEGEGITQVSEAGVTSDTYTVVLNTQPKAEVTISLFSDKSTTVTPELVFTAENWSVPQTVTVTAVDDPFSEGTHLSTVMHQAASADPIYNGIMVRSLTATVLDNDSKGISVVESEGATDVDEAGTVIDTYQIILNTAPTANVDIQVAPDGKLDVGKGRGVPITLNFNPSNWNIPQTVTVTGILDNLIQGPHDALIRHTVYTVDGSYSWNKMDAVTVHVTDNTAPGSNCFGGGLALIAALGLFHFMLLGGGERRGPGQRP
jgi:hypothetical protein